MRLMLVTKRYGGTRLGRQELNAELLEDTPGALWTRAMLEAASTSRYGKGDRRGGSFGDVRCRRRR
jgi:phage terminase large subunit-like protein